MAPTAASERPEPLEVIGRHHRPTAGDPRASAPPARARTRPRAADTWPPLPARSRPASHLR